MSKKRACFLLVALLVFCVVTFIIMVHCIERLKTYWSAKTIDKSAKAVITLDWDYVDASDPNATLVGASGPLFDSVTDYEDVIRNAVAVEIDGNRFLGWSVYKSLNSDIPKNKEILFEVFARRSDVPSSSIEVRAKTRIYWRLEIRNFTGKVYDLDSKEVVNIREVLPPGEYNLTFVESELE